MTTFDDREKAFEQKFAHDEELRFRVEARRNKLLGLWLAGLLGKQGADAENYAKEVVIADMEEAGDDDVIRKVCADAQAFGLSLTKEDIRRRLNEFHTQAMEQIRQGI